MAVLRNTGVCAIIVPGMDVDAGLVVPGHNVGGVPLASMASDFIQGCIERGELVVVEDFTADEYDTFRNPQAETVEPDMAELRAEAEALGIEVSKRWSRDTLVTRIAEKRGE